jgi:hypothetical protein
MVITVVMRNGGEGHRIDGVVMIWDGGRVALGLN